MSDADRTGPYSANQPAPPPAKTVGRFILGPELGRGAFGVVHRAYDPDLGREVAVKLPTAVDLSSELVERFTREAKAAAGLRHKFVVTVFDVGVDAGRPFIAMELVEGATLAERLAGRPTQRQAAEWVRDLALALHHAHSAGVLHRDVKPGNVLIDSAGCVRLTDFGISKLSPGAPTADDLAPALTRDGAVLGSPGYMAPEQARGDVSAVGPGSDQYSLGVVLYELVTDRKPFLGSGGEVMQCTADPAILPLAPREIAPDVPLGLEAVILKAMSKDPACRYPTTADMAIDLQRWLKGEAVSAPLRTRGNAVRVCPYCKRPTKGEQPRCRLCGHGLEDAPIVDSADLPPTPPKRKRAPDLPAGASALGLRALNIGLRLIRTRVALVLWAVGLLTFGGVLVFLIGALAGLMGGTASDSWRWAALSSAAAAAGLLAIGQLLEVIGLGFCLRGPAASGSRKGAAAAIFCQLAGPLLTGVGLFLATGPGRDEIIPIVPAKEPAPIFAERQYPGVPGRQTGMTKFEPATGPAIWVVCLAAGALLGAAGWAASVLTLGQLALYLRLRAAEGQAIRILIMGAAVAFGPSLLFILASFVLLPWAFFWFTGLVALTGFGMLIYLLLTWYSLAADLRYELGRRLGDE